MFLLTGGHLMIDKQPGYLIPDLFPPDHVIHQVLNLERAIDQKLVTKQIDMADAAFRTSKARRTLRINITTQLDQEVSTTTTNTAESESLVMLTLRIEGRLLLQQNNPSTAAGQKSTKATTSSTTRKFSTLLKSLIVEFTGNAADPGIIEWNRQTATVSMAESDGFEIRRKFPKGSIPDGIRVHLQLDQHPPKYRLSPELASVLDWSGSGTAPSGTKPAIVLALWQYIKLHKLQESDEKKLVNNDPALQRIFGVEQMSFSAIPVLMEKHLLPLEPILLEHAFIKDDGGGGGEAEDSDEDDGEDNEDNCDSSRLKTPHSNSTSSSSSSSVYDLEVEIVEDAAKGRLPVNGQLVQLQRDIGLLDGRINEAIGNLRTTLSTHRILDRFARDPVGTGQSLLAGMTADQECLGAEPHITMDQLMRASVFSVNAGGSGSGGCGVGSDNTNQQQQQHIAQAIQQIVSQSIL